VRLWENREEVLWLVSSWSRRSRGVVGRVGSPVLPRIIAGSLGFQHAAWASGWRLCLDLSSLALRSRAVVTRSCFARAAGEAPSPTIRAPAATPRRAATYHQRPVLEPVIAADFVSVCPPRHGQRLAGIAVLRSRRKLLYVPHQRLSMNWRSGRFMPATPLPEPRPRPAAGPGGYHVRGRPRRRGCLAVQSAVWRRTPTARGITADATGYPLCGDPGRVHLRRSSAPLKRDIE
jgi:hypothetical protein